MDAGESEQRAPYDPMPHGPAEIGVGPWPGEWPAGAQYDADLLAHGDRRNVVDRYRYWTLEAIVRDLDTRRHAFHVAIEHRLMHAETLAYLLHQLPLARKLPVSGRPQPAAPSVTTRSIG